jgi:hypothetical protein
MVGKVANKQNRGTYHKCWAREVVNTMWSHHRLPPINRFALPKSDSFIHTIETGTGEFLQIYKLTPDLVEPKLELKERREREERERVISFPPLSRIEELSEAQSRHTRLPLFFLASYNLARKEYPYQYQNGR